MKRMSVVLLALVALSSGCATTRVTETWRNPVLAQTPPPQNVLVVVISPTESSRRRFEDALVKELRNKGVQAFPSLQVLSDGLPKDREKLRLFVQEKGFDSVLVSRMTDIDEEIRYDRAMGPYDYYHFFYGRAFYGPDYTVYETAKIDTSLFDARGEGKLLWSATTETSDPDAVVRKIPAVASAIVKQLERDDVLS
jgi:hypothetical protein